MMPLLFSLTGQSIALQAQDEIEQRLHILYPGCKVVKRPVGGSSIHSWQKNEPNYNAALADILAAIAQGYRYAASIVIQGQTDAKYIGTAAGWAVSFWAFSRDLRADAGAPNIPVVYGKLGKLPVVPKDYIPGYDAWGIIQAQQQRALIGHPAYHLFDLENAGDYDEDNRPYCHYLPGNKVAQLTVDAVAEKLNKKK